MSVNATKWVWDQRGFGASEKIVLLRLADHADPDGGKVYPGIKSVAEHTSLSERQVQRYIKSFVERGILVVEDGAQGGRGKTTSYRFTFLNPDIHVTLSEEETPTSTSPFSTEKGDTGYACANTQRVTPTTERVTPEAKRVTPVTQKGDTHVTRTVKNHQSEPSGNRPMPRNGTAQILTATLYEDVLRIGPPTSYKQVVGQAEQLAKAGCTPEELRDIVAWLRSDPFWSQKPVTMGLILSQRDAWRSAKASPPAPANVRSFPDRSIGLSNDDLERIARGEQLA